MTIRFSMLRSWPRTHSSSAKVLYIVPDKRLQSPEVTAWCTNCNVGSLADACSTCSSVSAACMTSLAKLKAYSVISTSQRHTKFKKKKRNSNIKFVDTQENVSSDSEVSSDEEENSQSDWPMFTVSHSSRRKADAIFVSPNNIQIQPSLKAELQLLIIEIIQFAMSVENKATGN